MLKKAWGQPSKILYLSLKPTISAEMHSPTISAEKHSKITSVNWHQSDIDA
jgi:hypothetical protein